MEITKKLGLQLLNPQDVLIKVSQRLRFLATEKKLEEAIALFDEIFCGLFMFQC